MKVLELLRNRFYQKTRGRTRKKISQPAQLVMQTGYLRGSLEESIDKTWISGRRQTDNRGHKAYGIEIFLRELRQELINETYEVNAVKRVLIPKDNGKMRAPEMFMASLDKSQN